jgi:hypothetical protein
MHEAGVLQKEAMYGGPVDPTTLKRKILQVPTGVDEAIFVPLLLQLHTASKIKVLHEGTG